MTTEDDDIASMLGDSLESFLRLSPQIERLRAIDRGETPPGSIWPRLAEQGWLSVQAPEARDGMGLGLAQELPIVSAFARHLVPELFIECAVMPNAVLAKLPHGEAVDALTREITSGGGPVALAWQERPRQTAIDPIGTHLTSRGLAGAKLNIPGEARSLVASVMIDGAPALVALCGNAQVMAAERRVAADGTATMSISLDDAAIEPGAVLARGPDALHALRAGLDAGLIAASVHLHTLCEAVVDKTIAHLTQRRQFGQALSDFQVLRHKVVDMKIALELARCSWTHALRRLSDAPGTNQTSAAISAAKARASDSALQVTRAAVQLHGAMGYTDEIDIGLYLKSALRWAAWGGNAHAHRHRSFGLATAEDAA